MMTMRSGAQAVGRGFAGVRGSFLATFSWTKICPSRRSTRQHEVVVNAGAASASPAD
jgi:hypothetical protein